MTEQRIRTDVAGLAQLINLPKDPVSVRWERRSRHGDSSLAAVVEMQAVDMESVLKSSRRLDVQTPVALDAETARLLFPAQVATRESDAGFKLVGISIEPSFFVNEKKSGLLNGKAVVLAADKLVFVTLYEM